MTDVVEKYFFTIILTSLNLAFFISANLLIFLGLSNVDNYTVRKLFEGLIALILGSVGGLSLDIIKNNFFPSEVDLK